MLKVEAHGSRQHVEKSERRGECGKVPVEPAGLDHRDPLPVLRQVHTILRYRTLGGDALQGQCQAALIGMDGKQEGADTKKRPHLRVLQEIPDARMEIIALGECGGLKRAPLHQ